MQPGQREDPQGVRVHLDPFTEVVHESVSGQQIVDHPKVDERVLVHPAIEPGPDDHDEHRDQHRPPADQAAAHRRPGSVGTGLTAFDRDTGRDRVRVDHLGQVAHSAMLAEAVTGTRSLSMPTLRLLVADAQATG